MSLHKILENRNEYKKQCYQIRPNIYFNRVKVCSKLLNFFHIEKFRKKKEKKNYNFFFFCKGFKKEIKFSPKFQLHGAQASASPRR